MLPPFLLLTLYNSALLSSRYELTNHSEAGHPFSPRNNGIKLRMVVQTCNPSSWEMEAGGSGVQSQCYYTEVQGQSNDIQKLAHKNAHFSQKNMALTVTCLVLYEEKAVRGRRERKFKF